VNGWAAAAGPDTGLPVPVEALLGVAFYLGPVLLAGLAYVGLRRGRRDWAAAGLVLLATSIYTEVAFLDLACSPDAAGCARLQDQLGVGALAASAAVIGAVAAATGRSRSAIGAAIVSLLLGLSVTLGYLLQATGIV
jgi:hypothetical protein